MSSTNILPATYPSKEKLSFLDVEIVIPVYNEEVILAKSITRLSNYLLANFPFTYQITIVDNASTDSTWQKALLLTDTLPNVKAVMLDQKGRGRALKHCWLQSTATVVSYMDVDLATDLSAFLPLVAPLLSQHSDLAIGTRLRRDSRVIRGPKRETISRCYNLLLKTTLRTHFSDAQCGFKAIRSDRARELLPLVKDSEWFFDTELLLLAQNAGLRIHEVPVYWTDDPDSRVELTSTILADLRGIKRMFWQSVKGYPSVPTAFSTDSQVPLGLPNQLLRFILIGVFSTLAYAVLFLFLHNFFSSQVANLLALVVTAILNTAANRRYTFKVKGRRHLFKHQTQGLVIFALGLFITSGSLFLLTTSISNPAVWLELSVLVLANWNNAQRYFWCSKLWH